MYMYVLLYISISINNRRKKTVLLTLFCFSLFSYPRCTVRQGSSVNMASSTILSKFHGKYNTFDHRITVFISESTFMDAREYTKFLKQMCFNT